MLAGGLIFGYGTGSEVRRIRPAAAGVRAGLRQIGIVIAKPPAGVSTAAAYGELGVVAAPPSGDEAADPVIARFFDAAGLVLGPAADRQVNPSELTPGRSTGTSQKARFDGNPGQLFELLENGLEAAAERLCPEIRAVKERLQACGARRAMVSGSGSAVAGFCGSAAEARQVEERLERVAPPGWFIAGARLVL
jgi:4-diphosphocytidyl-2C-methyl-D-erythritol kinase